MRVFFLTANDHVFLPDFCDLVFSSAEFEAAGLAVVKDPHALRFLANSLKFLGLWQFAREAIGQVTLRASDILAGFSGSRRQSSLKHVCRRNDIPYFSVDRINSGSFRRLLRDKKIDLLVSVACPQIFGRKLLSIPPKGCINVHYGLLPRYRGMYPSFWVLANGEKETGVSVHYMVEGIDAGDILVQEKAVIEPDDTFHSLVRRLKTELGPGALLKAIGKIRDGDSTVISNDPKEGSYFGFPTREAMKRFRAAGRKWR